MPTRMPNRREMSATRMPIMLSMTPMMLAASIWFASEYSIINNDSGRVVDVLIKTMALMSRTAEMNTIAKMLTNVGKINGKVMRQ